MESEPSTLCAVPYQAYVLRGSSIWVLIICVDLLRIQRLWTSDQPPWRSKQRNQWCIPPLLTVFKAIHEASSHVEIVLLWRKEWSYTFLYASPLSNSCGESAVWLGTMNKILFRCQPGVIGCCSHLKETSILHLWVLGVDTGESIGPESVSWMWDQQSWGPFLALHNFEVQVALRPKPLDRKKSKISGRCVLETSYRTKPFSQCCIMRMKSSTW